MHYASGIGGRMRLRKTSRSVFNKMQESRSPSFAAGIMHLLVGAPDVVYLKLPAVAGDKPCPALCAYLALSPSAQQFRLLDAVSRALVDAEAYFLFSGTFHPY